MRVKCSRSFLDSRSAPFTYDFFELAVSKLVFRKGETSKSLLSILVSGPECGAERILREFRDMTHRNRSVAERRIDDRSKSVESPQIALHRDRQCGHAGVPELYPRRRTRAASSCVGQTCDHALHVGRLLARGHVRSQGAAGAIPRQIGRF